MNLRRCHTLSDQISTTDRRKKIRKNEEKLIKSENGRNAEDWRQVERTKPPAAAIRDEQERNRRGTGEEQEDEEDEGEDEEENDDSIQWLPNYEKNNNNLNGSKRESRNGQSPKAKKKTMKWKRRKPLQEEIEPRREHSMSNQKSIFLPPM